MVLSHPTFAPSTALGRLAVLGALLLRAGPVAAQQPGGLPRIPPEARGYQRTMIYQKHFQQQAEHTPSVAHPTPAPAPRRTATTAWEVVVSAPTPAPTTYVTVKGPDGRTRTFPVVGGPAAIQTRRVIVHAGESVRVTVAPPKR